MEKQTTVTYDSEVDGLYVYLLQDGIEKSGIVSRTEGDYPLHFDYDHKNNVVGIELLEASSCIELSRYIPTITLAKKSPNYEVEVTNEKLEKLLNELMQFALSEGHNNPGSAAILKDIASVFSKHEQNHDEKNKIAEDMLDYPEWVKEAISLH